jgi:glyoxylase-like metal-dependent hydrolase (beta-lactamase superfamily II)
VFPYLERLGLHPNQIDIVIVTHPDSDHCGGNSAVKQASPRTSITCGEADRELVENPETLWTRRYDAYREAHGLGYGDEARRWNIEMLGDPQPVDFTWSGGETLRLGPDWLVEIHHTPGHSRGHLSVYDPRSRTVLIGDAVQGAVYLDVEGRPALCPTYLHVESYLNTVRYLRALKAETLAGCHWPVKRGAEVDEFLSESSGFVELAERSLIAELRRRPSGATLRELIEATGALLGDWHRQMDAELMYALAGNIEHLAATGRVHKDNAAPPVRYRLVLTPTPKGSKVMAGDD